jgi:hypothetical protein
VDHKLLGIYLNDHLAGATAGRDLARRAAGSNADDSFFGPPLARLAAEIDEDRDTLLELMRELGVGEDRIKEIGGWAGEKLGRLKLNGQLRGYSPLSRMIELEGLSLGVAGKLSLWLALAHVAESHPELDPVQLRALIVRAQSQQAEAQELRLRAAELAFVKTAAR